MIEPITDIRLIDAWLSDPDVLEGFNQGEPVPVDEIDNAIYLHCPGVGLFPVRTFGKLASIHAAIPKQNRGKMAVKAGKMAVEWLKRQGFEVRCRVGMDRPEVMNYVVLCGFERIGIIEGHVVYSA